MSKRKVSQGRNSFFYSNEREESSAVLPFKPIEEQSELPSDVQHTHILEQIATGGQYESKHLSLSYKENIQNAMESKIPVHMTINITDINMIDPVVGCFTCKYRLYLFWEVDLYSFGFHDIADKAKETGHFYSASKTELSEFETRHIIPHVLLFNAMEVSETEHESPQIRIYSSNTKHTALLWNMSYTAIIRARFELHDFPFDTQQLNMIFRLNDPYTWDTHDLTIDVIQFHIDALNLPEWEVLAPRIRRDIPAHAVTNIYLQIRRKPNYYIQNIAVLSVILAILGEANFVTDSHHAGERQIIVLTIVLTVVAFKFTLVNELPKVPYNTLLDYLLSHSFFSLCFIDVLAVIPEIAYQYHINHDREFVNNMCAIVGAFIVIIPVIIWSYIAYLKKNKPTLTQPIIIENDNIWYAFRYCKTPPYIIKNKNKERSSIISNTNRRGENNNLTSVVTPL
mmetsp:Transcript_312/g.285  ORF Transcript_312/g.285 Transcript_312/m.285 type:complete len:454 (-) Transcript_312:195-1556(-)